MQLIHDGKTAQSLQRFKFPKSLSLSDNPKHFSNTAELLKFLDKITISCAKSESERLKLEPSRPELLILDVLRSHPESVIPVGMDNYGHAS